MYWVLFDPRHWSQNDPRGVQREKGVNSANHKAVVRPKTVSVFESVQVQDADRLKLPLSLPKALPCGTDVRFQRALARPQFPRLLAPLAGKADQGVQEGEGARAEFALSQ